ncbi:MATE family efflux transporter [Mobilibacterium timonense]|uniref:MATE family efflux transporter n=1 Tax=Mobilibacterium timonense TaxID=1871012 RepID=UPI0009849A21|nr:MATE family efflux transporter [Mobilibacterium timonense]
MSSVLNIRRKKQPIQLSDHFSYGKMIRFTLPSICMMIFTSIYGIVDGFFVSNYVGAVPFAALNLAMPFIMILSAFGFMFGSGGTALVSMRLGMGEKQRANETFSLLTYVLLVSGIVLGIVGTAIAPWVCRLLGATEEMMPYAVQYTRINMLSLPFFMLQRMFQSFMITAERPHMGLVVTVISGCTNMVLDWLFVGVFSWGLAGAAYATVISEYVGGLIPLVFFLMPNNSPLRLGKTHFHWHDIVKASTNGSSEFLSVSASSIIGMLYNLQLLRYAGTDGVAAYGVIMYVNFVFTGIYFGYTMGISPVIGFHYGAENEDELKNLFKRSAKMLITASVVITILSELASRLLVGIFVGYDPELMALTVRGFRIYSIAFLFMGINIFGSGFFTALNNGGISAMLSVTRSLGLQLISIYLLPYLLGTDGLWLVVVVSDGLCLLLTIYMLARYRKKYHYI